MPLVGSSSCECDGCIELISQHGFSDDNLRELRFAVEQMRRLSEEAVPRYVQIVDQVFKEFFAEVNTDRGVVDIEVRERETV